jgi:hypothetical protein
MPQAPSGRRHNNVSFLDRVAAAAKVAAVDGPGKKEAKAAVTVVRKAAKRPVVDRENTKEGGDVKRVKG